MAEDGIYSVLKLLPDRGNDNTIRNFYGQKRDGAWMRWLAPDDERWFLYLDNLDNFEFYGTDVGQIPPNVWDLRGDRSLKIVNMPLRQGDWEQLEKQRKCVYSINMHPSAATLSAMATQRSTDCDQIQKAIQNEDIFDGVDVYSFAPPGRFDVGKFLAYAPMSESKWMTWVDQPGFTVYHDADGNTEVYTRMDTAIDGLEAGPDDTIYVKLNSPIDDKRALRVARARLYKKTNDLHATQEQLADMIELISSNPPYRDLKTWGDTLYKREAKADKTGWTFKPKAGSLPLKPQFYFNPKPLKKGDQSEYDKGTRIDHTSLLGLAMSSNWDKAW
jgi:hypothetical protein